MRGASEDERSCRYEKKGLQGESGFGREMVRLKAGERGGGRCKGPEVKPNGVAKKSCFAKEAQADTIAGATRPVQLLRKRKRKKATLSILV